MVRSLMVSSPRQGNGSNKAATIRSSLQVGLQASFYRRPVDLCECLWGVTRSELEIFYNQIILCAMWIGQEKKKKLFYIIPHDPIDECFDP